MAIFHKPVRHELTNGIPVILQHFDGNVAASYWWVRTGSADERPEEAGYAHFLEHMLFKDASAKETGRGSTGQLARTVEALGGEINAYTSFDQTVYHVTCASEHWEQILTGFGALARPQKFLKTDFMREREVILEELRKNEDSPERALFEDLFKSTYSRHPYGRPVIGNLRSLKNITVARLEAFYRRNYISGNMGLVLVGPLDGREKEILKIAEKRFGSAVIPRKASGGQNASRRPVEPELRPGIKAVKRPFDVNAATLAVSFRVPELKHEDLPALDLLANVLVMGELSRVYQRLFYKTSLSTDISGSLYVPRDPGMLYFQTEISDVSKVGDAAAELFDELARIGREPPTDEEVARVLVNVESERLYATQTADGLAGRLGFLGFVLGDLDFDRDYLEELRRTDRRRVHEVASKYLDPRRMSIALILPKANAEFPLESLVEKAGQAFPASEVVAPSRRVSKASSPGAGEPEFFTRPSGIRVAYRQRLTSHVASVHASVLGGLRLEVACPIETAETDWGTSYMLALTLSKGTVSKDARAISSIVEGSAAGLDGFSGRNTIGAHMTGLARDWTRLSSLFGEVLVEPSFAPDEVEHSRRVVEDGIRSIEDHSSQLCSKLFLSTLFEKHPYGRLTLGSLESLPHLGSEKLRAFHRAWVKPERLVLSVAGAVRRGDLDAWLDELEGRLSSGARAQSDTHGIPATCEIAPERQLQGPRWAEKHMGREQYHIIVGGLGTTLKADDRHAMRLMQTLLGGQSGRLFMELRERKSLAYAVSPISFEGIEPGYVGTYIACNPEKKDEALLGIREVLEGLAAKGPTVAEVKRAQEYLLGRRAMDLQSDPSLAAHYGLEEVYGIPYLSEERYARVIRSVSAKQIQAVCRKYLVEAPMVTCVVG